MKVKVYAKLNLTLNVLGKRDGFHIIDSVATSVNICDVVTVNPRPDREVAVFGVEQVAPAQNTAYKAAYGFVRQFGTCGVDITIEKGIPFGAGMGGSSADAAAVVYCMCSLFNVDVCSDKVHALCASVGSDVTYMLRGGLGILKGKGDDVTFGNLDSPWYFALTTFDTSVSTAEVYSQFDKLGTEQVFVNNSALMEVLQKGKAQDMSECFNNHLQVAAASLSNYADNYLQFCNKQGYVPNMTGSGSAYYVAFVDEQSARNTAELLTANGFNTVVCQSVSNGIEMC